ncbi:MAG: magnesium and cobalt exporter, family [Rhodospirillaceae bacterium]|nr:magnesium and cobalt exporter, family [Rhodospirillaceae bacterium]
MIWELVVILLLLGCSAFFAAAETALTAASRPRMHGLESQGDRRAQVVNRLRQHMEQVIGAVLLGNNLVNILASALATSALIRIFGEHGVVYATIAMTVLVVVFGEVLPKTYAINNPERLALLLAPAMQAIVRLLSPIIRLMQLVVRGILQIFGARVTADLGAESAEAELRGAIDLHAGASGQVRESGAMLHSILDLGDVTVADIMVHRSNLSMIDADQSAEQIVEEVLASPYTRLPLWRGDPDNIIGVLHAKALLRAVQANGGKLEGLDVVGLALPPWFVPESTTLRAQLRAFRSRREHFALVVDEYGTLMGTVTLEDIIEEIVGDIGDEHDLDVPGVKVEPDGSYLVDGTVTIRDLNREFGWRLPDDVAATVAGLVLHEARRIPEPGQVFVFHGFRFEVMERQRNQIRMLKITAPPSSTASAA